MKYRRKTVDREDYNLLKIVIYGLVFVIGLLVLAFSLKQPEDCSNEIISPLSEATPTVLAAEPANDPIPDVYELTKMYAHLYGVDEELALCILEKESNGREEAIGDGGLAHGAWQFHLGTWKSIRKHMDASLDDDRMCRNESTRTAMYAIANGWEWHWTGYRKCI